jgi:hypothetical protein
MTITRIVTTGAFGLLLVVPAFSQEVQERKDYQQERIAQGVQSGELTAGETAHLEGREAALNAETRGMRALNGGTLSAADKSLVNRQQNGLSRQIYADKHNGYTQGTPTTEVGQRKENQQDRIAQGIRSGQLTAGETANLEHKEAGLNRETRGMRALNGGTLTPGDKALVNHQQNNLSRQIYNKKHNARTRP